VSGNTAYYGGGGISSSAGGDLTLINSTVSGNTARHYYGGGIRHIYGDLTLTNSTVSDNTASRSGGGIWKDSGHIGDYFTITNSTVSGNTSYGGSGGGISGSHLTLTNSTVSGNTAGYGFGGGLWGEYFTITNSTVSGNTAYSGGGISGEYMTVTDSTVSGNHATYEGGGIYSGGSANLTNTIVADNGTTTPNCDGALDSLGYNLADDDSCGFTALGDLVVADAMLGPLADNGGPTETHALLAGSPAIDAGSPACPPPVTDQRGVLRPQGAACDIGAFESGATPPGTADCLCEVENINPNQVVLQNVGTGGKGAERTRDMVMIVRAVDAPGATCGPGEFSNPTLVNLKMEDDGGNLLVDSAKTVVCKHGVTTTVKRSVLFQGPLNCESGAVPPPKPDFSLGTITSTGSAPGTTDYVESTSIKCFE
jgi:predicted outer membrane repeat protein